MMMPHTRDAHKRTPTLLRFGISAMLCLHI